MAQEYAIVRDTLPISGGNKDFTSSGFGTPVAALMVAENTTTTNPKDDAVLGIGFWDGTNQRAVSVRSADNVDPTDTFRFQVTDRGICLAFGGGFDQEYTVSNVTDGINFSHDVGSSANARNCTVLLMKGISAKVGTITPNSTENGTQESIALGFTPKLILFASIGHGTANQSAAQDINVISFGVAEDSISNRMAAWSSNDNVGNAACTMQYSSTRCVGQAFNGALQWSAEVTTFGSNTFTLTTRDGTTGGDEVFFMALGGADFDFDVGELSSPTGTAPVSQDNSTGVTPDILLAVQTLAANTTIKSSGPDADSLGIGFSDGTNDYSHQVSDEDNAGISNANSRHTTTEVVSIDSDGGGTSPFIEAEVTSFASDKFVLNWTTTEATARKGWWVVFGDAPAGGTTIVPPTEQLEISADAPSRSVGFGRIPGTEQLQVVSAAPSVNIGFKFEIPTAQLTIGSDAPNAFSPVTLEIPTAQLLLEGYIPFVDSGGPVVPNTAQLQLVSSPPTIAVGPYFNPPTEQLLMETSIAFRHLTNNPPPAATPWRPQDSINGSDWTEDSELSDDWTEESELSGDWDEEDPLC